MSYDSCYPSKPPTPEPERPKVVSQLTIRYTDGSMLNLYGDEAREMMQDIDRHIARSRAALKREGRERVFVMAFGCALGAMALTINLGLSSFWGTVVILAGGLLGAFAARSTIKEKS